MIKKGGSVHAPRYTGYEMDRFYSWEDLDTHSKIFNLIGSIYWRWIRNRTTLQTFRVSQSRITFLHRWLRSVAIIKTLRISDLFKKKNFEWRFISSDFKWYSEIWALGKLGRIHIVHLNRIEVYHNPTQLLFKTLSESFAITRSVSNYESKQFVWLKFVCTGPKFEPRTDKAFNILDRQPTLVRLSLMFTLPLRSSSWCGHYVLRLFRLRFSLRLRTHIKLTK